MYSCSRRLFCAAKLPTCLLIAALLDVVQTYNLNINAAIVFSDPQSHSSLRGNYFGYSLAIYNAQNFINSRVVVGAPRANSSFASMREPGAVFVCSVSEGCKEFLLDGSENGRIRELEYGSQVRDNSWAGAVISVEDSAYPRVVVCAPRWKLKLSNIWYMNGICYYTVIEFVDYFNITNDFARSKILPLSEPEKQTDVDVNKYRYYNYGMGEAGFSLHTFSNNAEWSMLIGSPGIINGFGAPILTTQTSPGTLTSFVPSDNLNTYRYLGYSVTSGNYFKKTERVYAAGAPRSIDMKGMVIIFLYPRLSSDSNLDKKEILSGSQLGESFGASLASCDVNDDGRDELIVGAPLWTKNGDEGRVYIFTARTAKGYTMIPSWIDGTIRDARFGSAVACLGDLDRDGFNDVAIGAPFEYDRGAVYIFNGRHDGLSQSWSQRITGDQFTPSLRGFGYSIAEPRDIDQNGYSDVAVGAYQSGHAVLLRAQPVVVVKISIVRLDRMELQRNSSSISLHVCSFYDGAYAPNSLEITVDLAVDMTHGRATILDRNRDNGTYKLNMTLTRTEDSCETVTIVLMKTLQNVIDPVEISASLKLNTEAQMQRSEWQHKFCFSCSVINERLSITTDSIKLPFALDCGSDNVCYSNLTLSASTSLDHGRRFIVGSKDTVKVYVDVHNYGEPAYQAKIHLLLSQSVDLTILPPNCVENAQNRSEVACDIGNPVRHSVSAAFELNMNQVDSNSPHVGIFVFVSTQSENTNLVGSRRNLTILLAIDVDLTVVGKSTKDNIDFTVEEIKRHELETIRFQHVYEIRKFGATPIDQSLLVVYIPTHLTSQSKTKLEIAQINKTDLSLMYDTLSGRSSICVNEGVNENIQEDLSYLKISNNQSQNAFLFNCTNPLVACTKISCTLDTSPDSTTVAEVAVTIDLHLQHLIEFMKDEVNLIDFASNGRINFTLPSHIEQKPGNRPDTFVVNTTFIKLPTRGHVALWIIVSSIVLGIILLALLIFGLIKLGFFNRRKKKELDAMKSNEDTNHDFTIETTSSQECLGQD